MILLSPRLSQRAWATVMVMLLACTHLRAAGFSRPDSDKYRDLFLWTDTCNV
jgi:hypothetical protein